MKIGYDRKIATRSMSVPAVRTLNQFPTEGYFADRKRLHFRDSLQPLPPAPMRARWFGVTKIEGVDENLHAQVWQKNYSANKVVPFGSYVHPSVAVFDTADVGKCVRAIAPIARGAVVAVFNGIVTPRHVVMGRPTDYDGPETHYEIQVSERHWLNPPVREAGDYFNHSCEPNCLYDRKQPWAETLVALRDIAVGEELTYDYRLAEGDDTFQFDCLCCTPTCGKVVSSKAWEDPDFQERYRDQFPRYMRAKLPADTSA